MHLHQRFLDAAHEKRRHQAGEEAARADDDRVERTNGPGNDRMNGHLRLEPDPSDLVPACLPRVDFDFTASKCPVRVLGADRRALDADGEYAPAASEKAAQSIHGSEEVAAVGLHHREQQIAAGVTGEPIVLLERRQS